MNLSKIGSPGDLAEFGWWQAEAPGAENNTTPIFAKNVPPNSTYRQECRSRVVTDCSCVRKVETVSVSRGQLRAVRDVQGLPGFGERRRTHRFRQSTSVE
ncbi:hypothetical protein L596_006888 [Steinernema carpocapsae]|uniref:Uncharacterized protein n=1 Tax=Steinernema carpocapsae TaxID=34508 RepID=A0A4U5P7E3_STECR|nr:hypothetical protein L596_006888 [Steinernema carpocapsae]